MPDEQIPCATMIIRPPSTPQKDNEETPTIIKDICTTEE